ncbi:hypothetical protein V8G54_005957 [Vigna mungo]|uniref:Uncharacterized protein n=1 Tax=Vigna mungo TaxID=3915 RepID=A0AAQ3NZ58_VIGMU
MPTVTSESTDNLVGGHERSGEGSKEKTVSQCFLQSLDNCIAVRHLNPLPERTNRTVTDKALEESCYLLLSPFFLFFLPWRLFPRQPSQDREDSEAALDAGADRETLCGSD